VIEMEDFKRKSLIAEGQEFAKRYSWAKMAKETLKIYESTFKKENSNSLR
jgi:glycosyltransferase involved in cell wall biosynthesis